MKRTKLILLALLGLFLFNACNDKEPETTPSPYKTIAKLKSLTGISLEEAKSKLISLGYAYVGELSPSSEFTIHTFESNFKQETYYILEAKNTIFQCTYIINAEKNTALRGFEDYTKECLAFVSGKSTSYHGEASLEDEEKSIFTTHKEFSDYYIENKYNLETCVEVWSTDKEGISCQYAGPKIVSESIKSIILYADLEITPPSMLPKWKLAK